MSSPTLTPEQEALAQEITQEVLRAAEADLLTIVRTLLGKADRDLFGQTELHVRGLIHQVAVKAYDAVLAQKKTATSAPASPAPTAARPPATTATGPAAPSASSVNSPSPAPTTTAAAAAAACAPSTRPPA
jgi:hypothetical protein